VLVVLAGVAAGFINMMAGSGSLITLPVLIFAGLPANVANGTNRIAILLQNIVGVRGFHREKVLDFNRGRWLLVPTVLGALVGAQIAVELDEKMMRLSIAFVMIVMLFVILIKPNQWLHGHPERAKSKPAFHEIMVFFFVGVYGGFIQAGVGIFLLSALVLGAGYDLVRANAVKLLIVLIFTPFALFIFIVNHQVHWEMGLILAMGNMAGAWLGTRVAVKGGAALVRWVLMAVILASVSKLVWDIF
jgi:uncharacterized membrane protein YfcA